MNRIIKLLAISAIFFGLSGCFAVQQGNNFNHIAPGVWRGLFLFGEGESAEKVPVNFEVLNTDNGKDIQISFLNGKSKLKADSVRFWGDTMYMYFDGSKKYMRLIYEAGIVEGYLYDGDKKEYPIEFYAQYGQSHRFLDLRRAPTHDINGVWAMDILNESEEIIAARLELTVDKNKVFATLKTEKDSLGTDLEGTIQADKLLLSAFTGSQVLLLKADLRDSVTMGRGSIRYNGKELACSAKKVK